MRQRIIPTVPTGRCGHARTGELAAWRDGGGTEWPTPWPDRSEHWPRYRERQAVSPGTGTVNVMCVRNGHQSPISHWDDLAEARAYGSQIPCGSPTCEGQHVAAWVENHRWVTQFFTK